MQNTLALGYAEYAKNMQNMLYYVQNVQTNMQYSHDITVWQYGTMVIWQYAKYGNMAIWQYEKYRHSISVREICKL